MVDKNKEPKAVFAITERGNKTYWTRVGAAFTNQDGSMNIELDASPTSGRLQVRERDESSNDSSDRTERSRKR